MTNEAKKYSGARILAILADVNEDGQVFYLNEDLGTTDDENNGLSGEIEMAFNNGYGLAMMQFKEYLEKKREELFNTNCLSVLPYIEFIDEIIKELFGE